MQAERDELVKHVFPQLRKLCEQRGVTWGEVDLRWGITTQQSERGETLPICLAEIERSRPYFIGLLGERYGWVPDEIPSELIEQEPWLAEQRERSVTELEILHGVLNNPEMAEHTFFYFRNPGFVDSLPEKQRAQYQELPIPEEIEKYGLEEAEQRTQARRNKLAALKERIRASGFPVREKYPTPQQLGQWILEDLIAVIERLYPEGSQPDALEREAADQEAFALSRVGVYIGTDFKRLYIRKDADFKRLDAHATGNGLPLVVLGESGLGKSALLANWAMSYRANPPRTVLPEKSLWKRITNPLRRTSPAQEQPLVLMHFIGATPGSTDWIAMLRRVMGEFKHKFNIEQEIPDKPDELRTAFVDWLHMAAARGRVVLILDGLNQLEDRDQAPDLVWLPPVIPNNVRLVLSTLPGRPLDELKRRGWPALEVQALNLNERRDLAVKYLKQYTKTLDQDFLDRVVAAQQTANPLYLRTLLEELRLFGVYEQLDERIRHYLSAGTPEQLYQKVLQRYEEDYQRDHEGLVREAMSLLWAARRGLSENELLELLGKDGEPLPHAYWSPLYLAAEQSLVIRSGLLNFSHDYLRQAVEQRYLPIEKDQHAAHLSLAAYFDSRELDARKVDELPWQLKNAEAWQQLYDLLAKPDVYESIANLSQFDMISYWAAVQSHSSLRIVDAYQPVIESPQQYLSYCLAIELLLDSNGHSVEASALLQKIIPIFRKEGDLHNLQAALGNQALILKARGDLDGAMRLHNEEEQICKELGDQNGLQACLGNKGLVLLQHNDFNGAMNLFKEQERICRNINNKFHLINSLNHQGVILQRQRSYGTALKLWKETERISRELGNKLQLASSLGNQATILHGQMKLKEALILLEEKEKLIEELGDSVSLAATLGNKANIFKDQGKLDQAMALHKKKEEICRNLNEYIGLSISLNNQATILFEQGYLLEAMEVHQEEEKICRAVNNKEGLQRSLGGQAEILFYMGYPFEALTLLKETKRLCNELGDREALENTLAFEVAILRRLR
jgi:tetratricopeptide (TPR) repeat protein